VPALQARGGARLAVEARDCFFVSYDLRAQQLDRKTLPELCVFDLEHDAHTAFAELSLNDVLPSDRVADSGEGQGLHAISIVGERGAGRGLEANGRRPNEDAARAGRVGEFFEPSLAARTPAERR